MPWKLHFVSHTHWDREWYETFDAFRYRLVQLMDHLLDILEHDPRYQFFLLDGQTIVLEDYLEVKPENRERIKKMVQSGRIFVGPWYVLPDEFLVSGETHIRNLLFGKKLCREFGATMNIGYLPDSFGHIAQMPQILRKSGVTFAVLWRGVPENIKTSEFFWESPDGSRVLTLYMPFGYGVAAHLPETIEELARRITSIINLLSPFATTSHLLLMNGSDHVEPDPNLPSKLDILRKAFPEYHVLHSNLPYLFSCILKESREDQIPLHRGELRSEDRAYLLSGTLSTRVYLKQKHALLTHSLEGHLEPLFALLHVLGLYPYPQNILTYLWKLLLQNSPHDSICGCSIDPVHEEMLKRYQRIQVVVEKLFKEVPKALLSTSNREPQEYLVVFNPHPWQADVYVECDILLSRRKLKEVNFEESKLVSCPQEPSQESLTKVLKLLTSTEEIVPTILHSEQVTIIETPPYTLPEVFSAQKYRLAFTASKLPPLGLKIYSILPCEDKQGEKTQEEIGELSVLENDFYRLSFLPLGHFNLKDKKSGKEVEFALTLEDGGDAGDEYDYSPPEEDELISSLESPLTSSKPVTNLWFQKMVLHYHLSVPLSLTPDRKKRSRERVPLPVTLEITLPQKSRQILLTVDVENNACDHRLRLLFTFPAKKPVLFSGDHFAVLEREPAGKKAIPQKDFVLLHHSEFNLAILSKGLHECYYVQENGGSTIAITLLRAVGWLSRDDLLTRKGDAGWPFPTPGAQCLGRHRFNLAVVLGDQEENPWSILREVSIFHRPPLAFQVTGNLIPSLPENLSLLKLENPCILVSTLKKSEDREEIVLRLYNPTPEAQHCRVCFGQPPSLVKELSLLEEDIGILSFSTQELTLDFRPYEIKTLGLLFSKKREKEENVEDKVQYS